jgi:hypothetical protein
MTLCLFHLLNGVPLMAVSIATFALKIGDFSDSPKKNQAGSEAWLNGKIMTAVNRGLHSEGFFFPR